MKACSHANNNSPAARLPLRLCWPAGLYRDTNESMLLVLVILLAPGANLRSLQVLLRKSIGRVFCLITTLSSQAPANTKPDFNHSSNSSMLVLVAF